VIVPRCGWEKATLSDRETATTNAVFGPILNECDKLSVRAFGATFFGSVSANPTNNIVKRTVQQSATLQTKIQPKIGYFIDKMIVEKMNAEKRKKNKKTLDDN